MKPHTYWSLLSVFFVLSNFFLIAAHEETHRTIFEHYGIDSDVRWFSNGFEIATYPEDNSCSGNCVLAQNITDIIGYLFMSLYNCCYSLFMIHQFYKLQKELE